MGYPGFQWDYDHLDQDEVKRAAGWSARSSPGQLDLVLLDDTRMHYSDAALPDFEAVVNSAQFRR